MIFAGLYWMIWHTGNYWWLIAAGVFFLFSVILGQLAPVLFLPLFYKIERLNDPALTERMDKLAAGTGLTIEGVYRMGLSADTVKANAMLAGLGRTRRVLDGRHAAGKILARRNRSHLRPRDRPPRPPPHPEDDRGGRCVQPGRLLAARSHARLVGRHPDRRRCTDQQLAAGDVRHERVRPAALRRCKT